MLALLSPAKSLDFKNPPPPGLAFRPRFEAEAAMLAAAAAKLSARKLSELMGISPALAALNVARFQDFTEADERPAIHAFNGDVYRGFEAKSLDEHALDFAQAHVRILSGLYGLLCPRDLIRPYRLEMGTRWAPGRAKNLYAWWGQRVSDALAADVAAEGSGVVLNLASQEYWQVVGQAPPAGVRMIGFDFREKGPSGLRFNSFAAKRARGLVARWLCEHHITEPDHLRSFDCEGYAWTAEGSDDAILRFVKARA